MELLLSHTKKLSDRVIDICEQQNVEETQCEDLVRRWVKDIEPLNRPTVAGVIMSAKRKRWNLVEY